MKKFGEAIAEWMVANKKNSIKPSSYDRLETSLTLMKRYSLYWLSIDEIDDRQIQKYLNDLVADGYALSTIKKQYHLLTDYITYANVRGIIDRPYHKVVVLPSRIAVHKKAKEIVAYSVEEQERLNDIFDSLERPAYLAAILMEETGMRIGEVLALGWNDIDWRRRAVSVNKTVVRLGNHRKSYIQNEPKSYTSKRTIPLSKRAFRVLSEVKLRNNSDFVVHDDRGDPLSYEAVRWQITKACEQVDVPYRGQHAFRHTFATNCYNRGCDVKILSKLLGHSDVTITYNTYIHLFGDALEEMRNIID